MLFISIKHPWICPEIMTSTCMEKTVIFIDTGAFLARYIKRDQYHQQAVEFWNELRRLRERCYTSNFVLDETFTLLARRTGHEFAIQRARNIYLSKKLTILRPTHEDEQTALDIWNKYADQAPSFTDCISFAFMRKNKIKRVFSFATHFRLAGFHLLPV
jgi:uncharacterized protein